MSVYDCILTTQPGQALDDAKAKTHHVKDKSGDTVGFVNALPSFGRWKDISPLRTGFMFFRYYLSSFLFAYGRGVICCTKQASRAEHVPRQNPHYPIILLPAGHRSF
jgi:hypothetical protein